MSEVATTRRDFLMMAGMGAAAATLVRPSELFAAQVKAGGAAKPEKILVPAAGHPANAECGEDLGEASRS